MYNGDYTMFNLHEEKLNANNQNEKSRLTGKGLFLFWDSSLFLLHLKDTDAGKVIKKALLICQGENDIVGDFEEPNFEEPKMARDVFRQIMSGAISQDTKYEKKAERSRRYYQKKKQQEAENIKNQMPSNNRPTSVQLPSNYRPKQGQIKQENTNQVDRQNNTSQVDRQNSYDSPVSSQASSDYGVPQIEKRLEDSLAFAKAHAEHCQPGTSEYEQTIKTINETEKKLRQLKGESKPMQEGASNGQCNTAFANDSDNSDDPPF